MTRPVAVPPLEQENHHAASSFAVLLQPEHDFVAHLSKAERAAFRNQVTCGPRAVTCRGDRR